MDKTAEQIEREFIEAERDLLRLIGRLCVAAGGLDPLLDPHLNNIRKHIKQGYTPDAARQLASIGEELSHLGEKENKATVLHQVLVRAGFKGKKIKKVDRLWERLNQSLSGGSDAELDELIALLGWQHSEASPGLLGRLLGRGEEHHAEDASSDEESSQSANDLLQTFLNVYSWPEELEPRVETLKAKLSASDDPKAWVAVVKGVNKAFSEALASAKAAAREASTFLASLNQQLETIDVNLAETATDLGNSAGGTESFGKLVHDEMGTLSDQVRSSKDLSQLQDQVLGSLGRIQNHVTTHLKNESEMRAKVEQQNAALRDDVQSLEKDAFELRRKVLESEMQALRDQLTGLPNRRAYDQHMEQEYARWRRFAEPLAILVWDIDNFKSINDTFGHKAGDKVLKVIGGVLKKNTRETDFIARYGGEEIVVVLVGAEQEAAQQVAEKMRVAVQKTAMHSAGDPVKVTVSGGLSMFKAGDTISEVFERADKALYEAKGSGKNRCNTA